MGLNELVIRSQLVPPRQRRAVLRRPRLEARLAEVVEYPLTIVQAGTGYGKSTALVALTGTVGGLAWYTITEPDRDPILFLTHLVCAFETHESDLCEPAIRALENLRGRVTPDVLTPLINALTLALDQETVLVLDDYHLVDDVPEIAALVERLVDYVPPRLHVVIATRQMPPLEALTRWRVKGQVLGLTRADLAFTADEIALLFADKYEYPLSPGQARALEAETEGWAIALQMVWQGLQSGAVPDLDAVLGHLPTTLDALFDYLAEDVLARQPAEVQRFLLTTAVLRQMDGPRCDHLVGGHESATELRRLQEGGLFLASIGDETYRYQGLFHDFLRARLEQDASRAQTLHRQAAGYYQQIGQREETVYHLLEAQEFGPAARLIEQIGPELVGQGRFDSLGAWIGRLPEAIRSAQPGLELLVGDMYRLRAQFDEALDAYLLAERLYVQGKDSVGRSRALRGQAQVYLDTVRPLRADSLLEEALRILEPEEHGPETAALLDRLAENKLNLGYPEQAEALHHEARLLRAQADPGDIYLEARALVRTGRLADAEQLLALRAEEERGGDQSRPQRFHRETVLLLSLVHALQGDIDSAERCAREGITIGQQLRSAFVEAVGFMRLGHPLQLRRGGAWQGPASKSVQQAMDYYQRAIEQVRTFKVMRTQVEPLWGMCRALGYYGDLGAAERVAGEALEIVQRAGDEWMQNLVQVTRGASHALSGQPEKARELLSEAVQGFGRVGDPFGQSAARLWQALTAWWQEDADGAADCLLDLLPVVRERGYDTLLTKRTFIGLHDEQAAIPLLLEAQKRGIERVYVERLLERQGLGEVEYHPGYALSVRTLGPFAVWRGDELVSARDWKREKARQIFQLLLTYPRQWYYREQIVDQLWPHLPPDAAERDFKVALNALHRALEPNRPRGAPPFFVMRRRNVYGLNPRARVRVDVADFERLAASDDIASLRQGLALYEEDYLPDSMYEDWPAAERQRLKHLYLVTAERLARHLLQAEAWEEAIQVCQAILGRDNCWEAAYRLLMRAHAAQENRPQVHNVYAQCIATLREELDVEPSPTTQALFAGLS